MPYRSITLTSNYESNAIMYNRDKKGNLMELLFIVYIQNKKQ